MIISLKQSNANEMSKVNNVDPSLIIGTDALSKDEVDFAIGSVTLEE